MARIRTIKPEFWQDERLNAAPLHVRLLFMGLISHADDEGRLRGNPLLIRAQVFPYDADIDVEGGLTHLERIERIQRYVLNGERYIWVCNFRKHQSIDKPKPSAFPTPPPPLRIVADASPTHPRHVADESAEEGKGREGNGRDLPPADADEESGELELELGDPKTNPVAQVLGHYTEAMKASGITARPTKKRRRIVEARLKEGFTPEQLMQAINGLTWSDWHMGRDPKTKGTRYTDLKYCIGEAERVEDFARKAESAAEVRVRL